MNLGNIFKKSNQNTVNIESAKAVETMSKAERNYRLQNEIRNLLPGQTIRGEVVARNGSSIQLSLANDLLINARLDQSINIALGQSMNFEVKTNNGSMLSLTPLYANMANEATILRALSAAGLPDTAENMEMVAKMMEEGMPIDKESVLAMSRQLLEFPNQDPAALIQMARLELPITEANIEQFQNYVDTNHQILGSVEDIADGLPQVFQELMAEGKPQQAYAFYEAVLDIFAGEEDAGAVVIKKEGTQELVPADEAAQDKAQPDGVKADGAQGNDVKADGALTDGAKAENAQQDTQAHGAQTKSAQKAGILETDGQKNGEDKVNSASARTQLSDRQWSHLSDSLKDIGVDGKTAEQVKGGFMSAKDVLNLVKDMFARANAEGFPREAFHRLLDSREFQGLLKTEMENQWLIAPKDVAQKEKVEQLYEKIKEQTMRLTEAFQNAGKADMPAAKSTQNLQNNVDFMNQLNHMFTYVQLPLKMIDHNAHGDLYVYTNKKSLAAKDGNVSALLHLDMEHLGPLDVYVTMQQHKVSTNFTLQDESSLELIEKNIHLLDERLTKRGYQFKAQFSVKEEAQNEEASNIMQTILSQDKNISVLSRTSFDMRA